MPGVVRVAVERSSESQGVRAVRSGAGIAAAVGCHAALHPTGLPARLPQRTLIAVHAVPLLTLLVSRVGDRCMTGNG